MAGGWPRSAASGSRGRWRRRRRKGDRRLDGRRDTSGGVISGADRRRSRTAVAGVGPRRPAGPAGPVAVGRHRPVVVALVSPSRSRLDVVAARSRLGRTVRRGFASRSRHARPARPPRRRPPGLAVLGSTASSGWRRSQRGLALGELLLELARVEQHEPGQLDRPAVA